MVKWEEEEIGIDTDINATTTEHMPITTKQLLDKITEFSEEMRSDFYNKKLRAKLSNGYPINELMEYSCSVTYDYGLLAKIHDEHDDSQSEQFKNIFEYNINYLKSKKFPCFLYSTIHWERKRMLDVGDLLRDLLEDVNEHDCTECFNSENNCQHQCCKKKALDFIQRCGVLRLTKKDKTRDIKSISIIVPPYLITKTNFVGECLA